MAPPAGRPMAAGATRTDPAQATRNGSAVPTVDPSAPWHALTASEALLAAGTSVEGLAAQEVMRRQAACGPNVIAEAPQRTWIATYAAQFRSPLVVILVGAAALALALGHMADALVILLVVVVNGVLGALQEGRAARSMAALRRVASLHARVLRGGREVDIAVHELVPGDILVLSAGDAIGADARLIDAAQLHAMEASLTGESVPVSKSASAVSEETSLADRHCMVYCGTFVTAGRGRAMVTAIAGDTEVGRIAGWTQAAQEVRTPLEARLDRFGRGLLTASLVLFVAVVALGFLRGLPLADVLMVAISQMVSVVPEGLPVAMTIALAVGMQRMAARGAIVRRLAAVETIGSITVICTDKTGTLTRNEMTVVEAWVDGSTILVDGAGYAPNGSVRWKDGGGAVDQPKAGSAWGQLLDAAVLCNDAELAAPGAGRTEWGAVGDPTEAALLVLARKAGVDSAAVRAAWPRGAELVFDTDAKLMATEQGRTAEASCVYVKGAPESVLRLTAALDGTQRTEAARAAADEMAGRALRVLAFAVVEHHSLDIGAGFDGLAGRARLLGLVAEIDPPRPQARAAVAACQAAGIRPVMVTGDHKLTGLAIARELGIARPGDHAVDGVELERMGEADLRQALGHTAVFARVQPAQKLRIVEALQARGEVVAMTGDGVNDAPALARADVGVAMGVSGTEVAKSAARIVITDDDFATIVAAVEQGRVVYANLKKVILFLFATSLDEVIVLLLALAAGFPLPLQAVQILWINIVTEGTITVNLVMDPADGDEMTRPPLPRDDQLVDGAMLARLLVLVPTTAAVVFGWYLWRLGQGGGLDLVRTETFTLMAMCQWFNVLNCQSSTRSVLSFGVLRNRWLLGGVLLSVALHGLVLYWTPLAGLFHTVPLDGPTLARLSLLGGVVLVVEEARKLVARGRAPAARS